MLFCSSCHHKQTSSSSLFVTVINGFCNYRKQNRLNSGRTCIKNICVIICIFSNSKNTSNGYQTKWFSFIILIDLLSVCVVVAFFLCWAPFHAQRLIYIYGTTNHQPSHPIMLKLYIAMTYISGVLYFLSTCLNPILYNLMSRKFRGAFKVYNIR